MVLHSYRQVHWQRKESYSSSVYMVYKLQKNGHRWKTLVSCSNIWANKWRLFSTCVKYFGEKSLKWECCLEMCMDGANAMMSAYKGCLPWQRQNFESEGTSSKVATVFPNIIST